MAQVLKITKSDGTIHVVPTANRSFYESYNRRQKADQKWRIEEIDGESAANLPFKDPNHIAPADATKAIQDQASEIERLKALLAAAEARQAEEEETLDEETASGSKKKATKK